MMAEGKQYAFRLNEGDEREASIAKWLKRKSRKRAVSRVIKDALHDAMTAAPDPNAELARAFVLLIEKLEAGGIARSEIIEDTGLSPDFMAHMQSIAQQARTLGE